MDKIPQSRAKCNSPRRMRWKNPPIPPQMRAIFRAAVRFFASRLENAERIWYNTLYTVSKIQGIAAQFAQEIQKCGAAANGE